MRKNRLRKRSLRTVRPSIPVPCVLALTCAVGIFVSAPGQVLFDALPCMNGSVCSLVLLLVLSVLFVFAIKAKRAVLLWAVAFFIIGIVLGVMQNAILSHQRAALSSETAAYEFILEEDSQPSASGSRASAMLHTEPYSGQRVLLFLKSTEQLHAGDSLKAETRLRVPSEEHRSFYDQRGIACSADIEAYVVSENPSCLSLVYQLRERLLNILGSGSDEQTLLRAILLGERSGLFDADFYHSIKVAGLAHLVAVSGAHLVIVTGFISSLLRALRVSMKVAVAFQTLFLAVYLILVGFPVSCIRAAIMSALALFALVAHRRASSLAALGVTVIVMMALDPCVVHQLSFQFSVSATFGIVLFMPLFDEWFASLIPRMPEFIRESISMTLAALVFSLPISVARFSMIPLLSPISNVIATPYLSLLLIFGFASLLFSPVLPFLLDALKVVAGGLIGLFSLIESIPHASLPASTALGLALPLACGMAFLVWLWWPTPSKRRSFHPGDERMSYEARERRRRRRTRAFCGVVLILVCLSLCMRSIPGGDRIVMLNVGQGDSFALMSGNTVVLIDTGNEPEMLYAALARNGIASIDAVLITHPDDDHCGSLASLNGIVRIDEVLVAEGLDEAKSQKAEAFMQQAVKTVGEEHIIEVNAGDALRFGSFTLDIVAPEKVAHGGENEDSICFYARIDCDQDGKTDWNAFFCGDAESEVLEELHAAHLLEPVDLYKVGHHGSRKALTPELAKVLSPKVSLIGVGKNSYGHPTEETLSNLASVNSEIYRSDSCGDVVCSFSSDALEVSTERSFR